MATIIDHIRYKNMITSIILLMLSSATGAYAEIVNYGFETGDFSGWTVVSGNAWGIQPPEDHNEHHTITAWDGRYYASTYWAGESATGVLRSDTETIGIGSQRVASHINTGAENWNWKSRATLLVPISLHSPCTSNGRTMFRPLVMFSGLCLTAIRRRTTDLSTAHRSIGTTPSFAETSTSMRTCGSTPIPNPSKTQSPTRRRTEHWGFCQAKARRR